MKLSAKHGQVCVHPLATEFSLPVMLFMDKFYSALPFQFFVHCFLWFILVWSMIHQLAILYEDV